MPELPEVEVVVRGLNKYLIGKKFKDVQINRQKMTNFSTSEFRKKLWGEKIMEVKRVGKMIIIHLDNGFPETPSPLRGESPTLSHFKHCLVFHLKMTGQLVYADKFIGGHALTGKKQFTRVVFTFTDGTMLNFNDQRLFGYCHLIEPKELINYARKYGMDPISTEFKWSDFWTLIQKHPKLNFKAFLLNQKHIAGLGNIYADEVAFRSGINPQRKLSEIKSNKWKEVHRNISGILNESIKLNGTTFSSFLTADGTEGNFRSFLQVYGRKDQPCRKCGTKLTRLKLAGRGTVVCEQCQA